NLPFSMVKLDRSLLISDSINDVIFKDILLMFKKLDKEIVVEGVETKQDLTKVIDLCPDHIQGFYYAKPMPIEQLIEFLSNSDH
ncbi:MAG: EAL domain-containing protein, partial [Erysipelotrichaceae bacterium]|nr:EAL domain-containing protein [Erysipelotrichaceae bacterium]